MKQGLQRDGNGNQKSEPAVNEDVLNSYETAGFLGAHVETVRRMARCGDLPAYKVGRDWRFVKRALTLWRDSHRLRLRDPLILIVSDKEDVRDSAVFFLKEAGYRTATADIKMIEELQSNEPNRNEMLMAMLRSFGEVL